MAVPVSEPVICELLFCPVVSSEKLCKTACRIVPDTLDTRHEANSDLLTQISETAEEAAVVVGLRLVSVHGILLELCIESGDSPRRQVVETCLLRLNLPVLVHE